MTFGPELLLVAAVGVVGVFHTIVPDHWVPIMLIARQRGWSKGETARASFQAGIGHVVSTLIIALVMWLAGAAIAERFGHFVDTTSSLALVCFGTWIAISAWRDLSHNHHGHSHRLPRFHGHEVGDRRSSIHGPELCHIVTSEGVLQLSIFEAGVPPRFRLSGIPAKSVTLQTYRDDGEHHDFRFANRGTYWESIDEIPEPHQFAVTIVVHHDDHQHSYETRFAEHDHTHNLDSHDQGCGLKQAVEPDGDPLYAPLHGETVVLTRHKHAHRHGRGGAHIHWHDHTPVSSHAVTAALETTPPDHDHRHKTTARTSLLLILGSSPMVEGIPAFFAAGKYGASLIGIMAIVFAFSTIATYMLVCVYSSAGLRRAKLGAFERYGEVLSGTFIAFVGLVFWFWPGL